MGHVRQIRENYTFFETPIYAMWRGKQYLPYFVKSQELFEIKAIVLS